MGRKGGKITRITLGDFITECERLTIYSENFTINSGRKSYFRGEKGTKFGEPQKPPAGRFFEDGWWTDLENNRITKAYVGDKVRFHIQTKGIAPGLSRKLYFSVYDNDSPAANELVSEFTRTLETDENGYVCTELVLGDETVKLLKAPLEGNEVEYYVYSYPHAYNRTGGADLADRKDTWLNVSLPPKQHKVQFASAADGHVLPCIFDAKTGDTYVISVTDIQSPEKSESYAGEVLTGVSQVRKVKKFVENLYGDRAFAFTVRKYTPESMRKMQDKVEKGMRRIPQVYKQLLTDVARKITGDANIDYAKNKSGGITKKINYGFKIGRYLTRKMYLVELAAMTLDVLNGRKPDLPVPAFISGPIDQIDELATELTQQDFLDEMTKAMFLGYGNKKGVDAMDTFFVKWNSIKGIAELGYSFIPISEEGLNILLSGVLAGLPVKIETENGEVTEIKDLRTLNFIGYPANSCGILVQHIEGNKKDNNHLDKYNRVIDAYNIIGIWTPPLIEKG